MKYSIIMPSYDPDLKNHDMFMDMIKSIEKNSKGKDYELIIRKNGKSYTESFNDAISSSSGEYIISVQDDMIILDPEWLEKLTDPDCFVSPEINKFSLDGSDCPYWAIFGMPRKIFAMVGLLDPIFSKGICYEDNDYIFRMREAGFKFKTSSIRYKHFGGVSGNLYFENSKKKMVQINRDLFINKWKIKK